MLSKTLDSSQRAIAHVHSYSLPPTPKDWSNLRNEVLAGRYGQPDYAPSESVQRCISFMQKGGVFGIQESYTSMFNKLRAFYR